MFHDHPRFISRPRPIQTCVPEWMSAAKQERRERTDQCARADHDGASKAGDFKTGHAFSASEESTIARWLCRAM